MAADFQQSILRSFASEAKATSKRATEAEVPGGLWHRRCIVVQQLALSRAERDTEINVNASGVVSHILK